jgi:hypothetical protein
VTATDSVGATGSLDYSLTVYPGFVYLDQSAPINSPMGGPSNRANYNGYQRTVTLTAGNTYQILLEYTGAPVTWPGDDTYLYLYGPSGYVTENDDSGRAYERNSAAPTFGAALISVTPTVTGTYTCYCTTFGNTVTMSSTRLYVAGPTPTTTSLTDNGPNPSNLGDAVSFTVNVAGGTAITGETVNVYDADGAPGVPVATPTLANGTATFNISSLSAGTHHLFAAYGGDFTHATSQSSQVAQVVNGPAPSVTAVVINGGPIVAVDAFGNTPSLAGQSAIVEQLLVTFNESVTLDDGAFAITNLWQQVTVNSGVQPNRLAVSVTPTPVSGSNNTQFVLTFSGPGVNTYDNSATGVGGVGNIFTTIQDGFYQLNVDGTKVHAYGQTAASNNTNFWALYGVATAGMGVAGIDEFILSRDLGNGQSEAMIGSGGTANIYAAYGSESDVFNGPPTYVAMYDINLDGAIDGYDLQKFYENFNTDWTF